jgi:DNA-binding transcriptional LysR family regulator
MELRHLRYFVAVAEELHFGRAAARLNISQPPLSQQIRRLEAELGTQLFNRSRRHVELTGAGQQFLPEARRTIEQADHAFEVAVLASAGSVGHLTVGFVSSASPVLPEVVRSFHVRAPRVEISVKEASSAQQIDLLRVGRIDAGLLRPARSISGLRLEIVAQERLVLAMPSDHYLANEQHLLLSQLADEPFVLFQRELGPGLFDRIVASCVEVGFSPQIAQVSGSMLTIMSLVAGELGVSIVPASLSRQSEGITFRSPSDLTATVPLGIAVRENDEHPAIPTLIEAVRDAVSRPLRASYVPAT